MRTVEDFGFRQTQGKFWKVTRGQVFDGRGMPPLFSDLVGPPYQGSFRKSSMVYESATQRMTDKWDEAQRMFFEAAVAEGVRSEARRDRPARVLHDPCVRTAHLHAAAVRHVFRFDAGAQAVRLSAPAGTFMTAFAALCDTLPRCVAFPRCIPPWFQRDKQQCPIVQPAVRPA
jgi:hypothetical protein